MTTTSSSWIIRLSGTARRRELVLDLNGLVPDLVDITMRDQVGRSAESYHFGGGVWGLPTDAAAQIAVYRPDLMDRFEVAVPENHDDVLAAAARLKSRGCSIAVPACPTDAMCLVMSYSANLGEPLGTRAGDYVSVPMLRAVLDLIRHLVSVSHPASTTINPIGLHDRMCSGDEIAYAPLAFGYSNYSRLGREPLLKAADFAGPGEKPWRGALLGGAGCVVTRSCSDPEAAADFLRWLHTPDVMRDTYFAAGGQPGLGSVWDDPECNRKASNFFHDTRRTLEAAYLRPTFDGFVPAFEQGGETVHAFLTGGLDREAAIGALRETYIRALEKAEAH